MAVYYTDNDFATVTKDDTIETAVRQVALNDNVLIGDYYNNIWRSTNNGTSFTEINNNPQFGEQYCRALLAYTV
jgi:hypothetical protein